MTAATKPVRRVLVAEDNEDHLFLTVRALRDWENNVILEVDAVSDGEELLDFLYRRGDYADRPRPHVILLDIKMPRVTGIEALERLKTDPTLRRIPVIVLSSSDRPEDVEAVYQLGGNTYVNKQGTVGGMRESLEEVAHFWMDAAMLPEPPD
ncbi:MAG: response regulator [Actinobacteria bacterium]|nr:response regulator [Actinomycetota bacterium]